MKISRRGEPWTPKINDECADGCRRGCWHDQQPAKTLQSIKPANILADPAASYWLKDALRAAMGRDPVDAANDAEALAQILRGHMSRILKETNQ